MQKFVNRTFSNEDFLDLFPFFSGPLQNIFSEHAMYKDVTTDSALITIWTIHSMFYLLLEILKKRWVKFLLENFNPDIF